MNSDHKTHSRAVGNDPLPIHCWLFTADLLKLYRNREWVESRSFKTPLLSDQCNLLKKPHITVRVS